MTLYDIILRNAIFTMTDPVRLENEERAIGYAFAVLRFEARAAGGVGGISVQVHRVPANDEERTYSTETFVAAWVPTVIGGVQGSCLVHPSAEGRRPTEDDLRT